MKTKPRCSPRQAVAMCVAFLGVAVPSTAQAQSSARCASPPTDRPGAHALLDGLLASFVQDGTVDYRCFQTHETQLDRYLSSLAGTDPASLSRDEQLALWINAYNAFTIKLILSRYPDLESIRDIPARWKARRWTVGGERYSLDDIEHEILRVEFDEPRIHFAIVCASISCPSLARTAYTGAEIDEQLEAAARRFLSDDAKGFQFVDRGTDGSRPEIRVSSIFKWFGKDFKRTGSVPEYIANFLRSEDRAALLVDPDRVRVRFLDYDWGLNDASQVSAATQETGTAPPLVVVGEDFFDGLQGWRTQRLDGRSTHYRVVEVDGNAVLKAASDDGATALIRSISIGDLSAATIRWRWRVLHSLMDETSEREKDGDDFAARLLVLFGDDALSQDTRALAYAWSGSEPVGASFPNPYTMSMITYVLQSGDEHAKVWMEEERDVFADYERAFGERPTGIAGIAILVDTDNTRSKTMAWFDDIELVGTLEESSP